MSYNKNNTKITTYAISGSWTISPQATLVEFYVWGGGAGGGSGRCGASASAGGGSGGGAGNLTHVVCQASQLTSSPYTITIASGGVGGIAINAVTTNGNPGIIGGTTSVGTAIVCTGGSVSGGGVVGTVVGGSSVYIEKFGLVLANTGGTGSNSQGSTPSSSVYGWATGGGGGSGYTSATPRLGGGGGSITDLATTVLVVGGLAGANSGATAGDGNSPSGLAMILGATGGGGGGHNGTLTSGTGGNGGNPGGGGGGGAGQLSSNASGTGGIGGNGQVIVIEHF